MPSCRHPVGCVEQQGRGVEERFAIRHSYDCISVIEQKVLRQLSTRVRSQLGASSVEMGDVQESARPRPNTEYQERC